MINKKFLFRIGLVAFLTALVSSCGDNRLAGGSSEIGNGKISGMVKLPDNSPAVNTSIHLYPSEFNPLQNFDLPDSLQSLTDNNGRFTVKVPNGTYNLLLIDKKSGTKSISTGIIVKDNNVDLSTKTLRKVSQATLRIDTLLQKDSVYVIIKGTPFFTKISQDKALSIASFDSLPSGTLPPMYLFTSANLEKIFDTVSLKENESAEFFKVPGWKYARKIFLNTSITGANIQNDLYNYPLVLNFSSSLINSSEWQDKGQDLRFIKSDGTTLPYEIEVFNKISREATIWVKIDTIFANRKDQYFYMIHGNAYSKSESNGPSVFSKEDGFAGVWHLTLNESGIYSDASGNRNDGIRQDKLEEIGIIGKCAQFTKRDQFIECGNLLSQSISSPITISFWTRLLIQGTDSVNSYQIISNQANDQSTNGFSLECISNWLSARMKFTSSNTFTIQGDIAANPNSSESLWETNWRYCVAILSDSTQELYFDNQLMVTKTTGSLSISPTSSQIILGGFGSKSLIGLLDEFRIERRVRDKSWIKFNFLSQRGNQQFIRIEE